jgi:hypothetical protein
VLAQSIRTAAIAAHPVGNGRINGFGEKERVMAKSITVSRALAKNAPAPPVDSPRKSHKGIICLNYAHRATLIISASRLFRAFLAER